MNDTARCAGPGCGRPLPRAATGRPALYWGPNGELSLTGEIAEDAFRALNCDLAFTEYNQDDARVKCAAIAAARRSVVLADSSKPGRVAFATVAPLSAIDAVVTDAPAARQPVSGIAAAGAGVIEAKVPDAAGPR